MAEKHSKLHLAAFTIETLGLKAHTKELETSLLSQAEFVRKVDEVLKYLNTAGSSYKKLCTAHEKLLKIQRENES